MQFFVVQRYAKYNIRSRSCDQVPSPELPLPRSEHERCLYTSHVFFLHTGTDTGTGEGSKPTNTAGTAATSKKTTPPPPILQLTLFSPPLFALQALFIPPSKRIEHLSQVHRPSSIHIYVQLSIKQACTDRCFFASRFYTLLRVPTHGRSRQHQRQYLDDSRLRQGNIYRHFVA